MKNQFEHTFVRPCNQDLHLLQAPRADPCWKDNAAVDVRGESQSTD